MSGLADLLPGPKQVEIDGKTFAVNGLSLAEFTGLLTRFPILDDLFSGKKKNVSTGDLLMAGNPAVSAIIAAMPNGKPKRHRSRRNTRSSFWRLSLL